MPKAIYGKYNVQHNSTDGYYSNSGQSGGTSTYKESKNNTYNHSSNYTWDSVNGYKMTGSTVTTPSGYYGGGSSITSYSYTSASATENQITATTYRCDYTAGSSWDSKGSYISDVKADYGSLPADGQSNGYWYVFVRMATDVTVNVGGINKEATDIYVNVGGINKLADTIYTNNGGIWKD